MATDTAGTDALASTAADHVKSEQPVVSGPAVKPAGEARWARYCTA
ncbi:hypothetical protein K788_0002228 [Paraburkholderia caribensis MBA4]|uniref:Uncharacterized protein n=1 Tax=Paraburkholderia caribensis MBA4 TaxID=1323664 RepID=A0A0P0R914_9BURK|nr:hypothetical protein K788_0002228 [Paraburkholderia caribensis MBA4]